MMKVEKRFFLRTSVLLAVVATVAMFAVAGSMFLTTMASASTPSAPLNAPVAAIQPATSCTLVDSTQTCELWAKEGTLALPGITNPVPIWGFTDTPGGSVQPAGPPIVVTQGQTVTVVLHNDMVTETVSLTFVGQEMAPALTGIAPGMTGTFTFIANEPGTFSYEAGMTVSPSNAPRQVAMGMYGGLIIRPSANANSAYGTGTETDFTAEALMVLSEIDLQFHADPDGFDMAQYSPDFWLINGKTYSQTEKIVVNRGDTLLLRYVNAGLQEHSMSLLGLRQQVLSTDGQMFPYPQDRVIRTMAGGETADSLVSIPLTGDVVHYPIYNAGLQQLHNNGNGAFGGILTFIEVSDSLVPASSGPLVDNAQITPVLTDGNEVVTLTAGLTSPSGLDITAWEYYINSLSVTPTLISLTTPVSVTSVLTVIPTTTVQTWPSGDVTVYVRAKDVDGVWGSVNSAIFDLVTEGPVISAITLDSSPTNGETNLGIQATATGDVDVVAAEYFIDVSGSNGTGIPINLSQQALVSSLSASIDAATIQGWTESTHTVHIHALDDLGNWGGYAIVDLVVDRTGPTAVGLSLTPNPNNGEASVNSSSSGVLLEIDIADFSAIETAEAFINYTNPISNPDGTGFPLIASDAVFNNITETAYFVIPQTTIRSLAEGEHTIDFHGKDVAGNWGSIVSMTLYIDKTGPAIVRVEATQNQPAQRAQQALYLSAGAVDAQVSQNAPVTVVAAEWFDGADPGAGRGDGMVATDGMFDSSAESIERAINISGWSYGTHVLSVRSQDSLGNWGDVVTTTVVIDAPAGDPPPPSTPANVFTDDFETANFSGWKTAVGNVSVTAAAALSENYGMEAALTNGEPAYIEADVPSNDRGYNFSFEFDANDMNAGGEEQEIFVATDDNGVAIFGIWYEDGPEGSEIMAWTLQAGGLVTMTEGIHITSGVHTITLEWDHENHTLDLYVDGILQTDLSDVDDTTYQVGNVRLGSSVVSAGASGSMYFDTFQMEVAPYVMYLPIVAK